MRKALSRLAVFLSLTVAFFAGAYSLHNVTLGFSRLLPENYRYLADRAFAREDYAKGAQICRKRIAQFSYDFDARFLLADVLTADGKYLEAAEALRDAIAKIPGTKASKAKVTGFDEGRLYLYFATSLWDAGKYFTAGEMVRAAMDAGSPWIKRDIYPRLINVPAKEEAVEAASGVALKTGVRDLFCTVTARMDERTTDALIASVLREARWQEAFERDTTTAAALMAWSNNADPSNSRAILADAAFQIRNGRTSEGEKLLAEIESTTGVKLISPGQFILSPGGTHTTNGINLSRNGTASAQVQTGVYRVTTLALFASGTKALGIYPIVVVKSGDEELARLYIDTSKPLLYYLVLWAGGSPKALDLKFEFTNDIYDPYTKSDRNVTLSHIMLL